MVHRPVCSPATPALNHADPRATGKRGSICARSMNGKDIRPQKRRRGVEASGVYSRTLELELPGRIGPQRAFGQTTGSCGGMTEQITNWKNS